MPVDDPSTIDGIGISKDNKSELVLFLSDHLDWSDEYEHLMTLQKKIEAYLNYIDSKQYETVYPDGSFNKFVIDIFFKYDIYENCLMLLDTIAKQFKYLGLEIRIQMLEEESE